MNSAFRALLILLLSLGQVVRAQVFDPSTVSGAWPPEAELPSSRVVDFGGIFSRDDGGFQELESRLDSLYERYGYSVYFVAFSGIIGSNVQTRSDDFRDQWLPHGVEGLVVVCDTDLERTAFSLTNAEFDATEQEVWLLPDHLVLDAMRKVYKKGRETEHENESDFLRFLGEELASNLETLLEKRSQPEAGVSPYYLVAFIFTALLILALAAWARRSARRESQPQTTLQFPEIEIPSRLGGQYGGGLVSEICHQPKSGE